MSKVIELRRLTVLSRTTNCTCKSLMFVSFRARNCDSLVANATKNQVLATRYLELVASGRLTIFPFNLKGKRHYLWMKDRYNKPNPRFFNRQLLLRHTKEGNPHIGIKEKFEMATCSKSPYNALQTLEHCVRHVRLRIASLLSGD